MTLCAPAFRALFANLGRSSKTVISYPIIIPVFIMGMDTCPPPQITSCFSWPATSQNTDVPSTFISPPFSSISKFVRFFSKKPFSRELHFNVWFENNAFSPKALPSITVHKNVNWFLSRSFNNLYSVFNIIPFLSCQNADF